MMSEYVRGCLLMKKIFNSAFEVSLRIMLMLSQTVGSDMSIDRIVAYDFISLYSAYFDLADVNLHGDNEFGFSELSARRGVVQDALKVLVLDGLVKVRRCRSGFCYEITEAGVAFTKGQKTDYANSYRSLVRKVHKRYAEIAEIEIMTIISQKATYALRR